jgi:hypothetical protein
MSGFVAWHSLAMIVAPTSDTSAVSQALRRVLTPYLVFFELDHSWRFFGPEVGRGEQLRVVISSQSGQQRAFVPSAEWHWFHPGILGWDERVMHETEVYAPPFVTFLCRKYAALEPTSISIFRVQENEFRPEDHLNGGHPLDPQFTTVQFVKSLACSST